MKQNKKQLLCAVLTTVMTTGMMSGCVPQKTSQTNTQPSSQTTSQPNAVTPTDGAEKENTNISGLPLTSELATYEVAAKSRHNKNFSELEFFQKLEENTNVHIEWNMSSEDGWKEKKGLLFAGELPDAFYEIGRASCRERVCQYV